MPEDESRGKRGAAVGTVTPVTNSSVPVPLARASAKVVTPHLAAEVGLGWKYLIFVLLYCTVVLQLFRASDTHVSGVPYTVTVVVTSAAKACRARRERIRLRSNIFMAIAKAG